MTNILLILLFQAAMESKEVKDKLSIEPSDESDKASSSGGLSGGASGGASGPSGSASGGASGGASGSPSGGPISGGPSGSASGGGLVHHTVYGNPSAGLYTGDELFKHVTAFVKRAADMAGRSCNVKLRVYSPFFDEAVMKDIMEKSLDAKNLSTVFITSLVKVPSIVPDFHPLKTTITVRSECRLQNQLVSVVDSLSPEHRERLLEKLESGKIKVYKIGSDQYFDCKWLNIEHDKEVQLLIASANLLIPHLNEANPQQIEDILERYHGRSQEELVEFAEYKKMNLEAFSQKFLDPFNEKIKLVECNKKDLFPNLD